MATTRERRLARAGRLREWGDKREARGNAELERSRQMADGIPFGQPILVGHHSERSDRNYRDRIWNTMGRGVENVRKGESMHSRADTIEAQADRAIYDDDPDATERLEARIAELEAERARIVAYNKSCRKGARDVTLLDDKQQAQLVSLAKIGHGLKADGSFQGYATSNLTGNIGRLRKRLEAHRSGAARRTREVVNRYAGKCDKIVITERDDGRRRTRRCGTEVAAGAGVARKEHGGEWEVFCDEHR